MFACAVAAGNDAFVGGRIQSAGNTEVENVARWDGASWVALVDSECSSTQSKLCGLNGVVYAMAAVGEYLYVGGSFTKAGGRPASNVAMYYSGKWSPLGAGVTGSVYAAGAVRDGLGACVVYGGDFTSVADKRGRFPASGLAQWCIGNPEKALLTTGNLEQLWRPMKVPEGVLQVRTVASFQG